MRLSPQELDKLVLHQAGVLAQKRLARGLRLNHPEAVALLATQVLELIRDGRSVSELMDLGKRMLGRRQVLPGVAELIGEVQVEGTFTDGSKLVTVHQPIAREDGDLALALHGSFLPVPALSAFGDAAPDPLGAPGAIVSCFVARSSLRRSGRNSSMRKVMPCAASFDFGSVRNSTCQRPVGASAGIRCDHSK